MFPRLPLQDYVQKIKWKEAKSHVNTLNDSEGDVDYVLEN